MLSRLSSRSKICYHQSSTFDAKFLHLKRCEKPKPWPRLKAVPLRNILIFSRSCILEASLKAFWTKIANGKNKIQLHKREKSEALEIRAHHINLSRWFVNINENPFFNQLKQCYWKLAFMSEQWICSWLCNTSETAWCLTASCCLLFTVELGMSRKDSTTFQILCGMRFCQYRNFTCYQIMNSVEPKLSELICVTRFGSDAFISLSDKQCRLRYFKRLKSSQRIWSEEIIVRTE